ncbi:SPOR domain-containing protein [Marinobacter sp.]|uniref:SPOR domain-containing protein n=1 Tax=Marinobacter sp. TaxID=50741 RepID=UPI003A8CB652
MDGLKQRIIGALVLVSLAVIFVPMLFDEPHSERSSTTIQIPEEPPFPEVETPETEVAPAPSYELRENAPEVPESGAGENKDSPAYRILEEGSGAEPFSEVREPAGAGQSAADNTQQSSEITGDDPEPAAEPAEPEAVEYQRSLEGSWVVQLGSFGNEDNARRLRDKVREKGYGSHLQAVVRGDATLTRVFSGPFATKSEAEAAKRALDDAFGVNSLVTSGEK